jgi:hypothetical protein
MAEARKTSDTGFVTDLISGISNLAGLFTSKKSSTTTSKSGGTTTQSSGSDITQEGINKIVSDILSGTNGLASVASGQKGAGLYNSSTNQQLVNDLLSRTSGEAAKLSAKTVTNTTSTPETVSANTVVPAQMNAGSALLSTAAAFGANAINKKYDITGKATDAIGGILDKVFGGKKATDVASSVADASSIGDFLSGNGFTNFSGISDIANGAFSGASSASSLVDGIGSFGGMDGISSLFSNGGGVPYISIGSDLLNGDVGSAALTAAGYAVGGPIGGAVASILPSPVADFAGNIASGLGAIPDALGIGSVVCTELYKQGIMSPELYRNDVLYAAEHMEERTLNGYRVWGIPLVLLMRSSKLVSSIASFFAISRAHYIASIYGEVAFDSKLARYGRIINAVGVPVCNLISLFLKAKDYKSLYAKGE